LNHGFPFVGVDNRALGKMVAAHLLEQGFRNFGVYEIHSEDYFEERRDDFVQSLRVAGHDCSVFHGGGQSEHPSQWERQQDDLARWVANLPKPVGIMACTDQLGFWLLDACKRVGLSVPDEVAVVGVENEETLCTMATPPLSSVPLGGERIGYEAAALLSRLMKGRRRPKKPILIAPLDIVVRQSSDTVAVEDPELAQAVQFIRTHACDGASVADVLRAVPLSRSLLERKMRLAIGRSPHAEIMRLRLARVKQLLRSTDLSLAQIARRAGFEHSQYMAELFKRKFGQTPGAYRAACRGNS
jgi:LacI family transcriptional regulator